MTTYLGEKAVGVGTVKATMSVGKVITDDKTIIGDGFTEPLAVNTLLFATSESVAASAEAVRTEFDGKLKSVETEITNVEDRVRELTKATDGEFVDVKLDVSDLKDADTQIRAEITSVEDDVRELRKGTQDELVDIKLDVSDLKDANQTIRTEIADKQDKLTAGENITIEDGVISATGGGGTTLPDLGNPEAAFLRKNYKNELFWDNGQYLMNMAANPTYGTAIGMYASSKWSTYSTTLNGEASALCSLALGYASRSRAEYAIMIGPGINTEPSTLKIGFYENTKEYKLLDSDGTIPLERLTKVTDQIGDISTALTAILGE